MLSSIWCRLKLRKVPQPAYMWTKHNLIYFLIGRGMHFIPMPEFGIIEYKQRLTRSYCEILSDKQILQLARSIGYDFHIYPFGDRLFYTSTKTETK